MFKFYKENLNPLITVNKINDDNIKNLDFNNVNYAVFLIKDIEKDLNTFPFKNIILQRYKDLNKYKKEKDNYLITKLDNNQGTIIFVYIIKNNEDNFTFTENISKQLKDFPKVYETSTILNLNCDKKYLKLTLRTVLAHNIKMPFYGKTTKKVYLKHISIFGDITNEELQKIKITNINNGLARYLAKMPPNMLNPKKYIDIIKSIAKNEGIDFKFYDTKELKKIGANAFLAVARSSRGGGIVKLSYKSKNLIKDKLLTFVGKGITFDTGGLCLKPPKYLEGMHIDMHGSSVALACFLSLVHLKVDFNVNCYLAICENNTDKNSYTPNEVLKCLNKLTVEIIDTDAEGRLALSDTLYLASCENPNLIVDFATLTGTSIMAIGTKHSIVFSNMKDELINLINTGYESGERVWPLPLDNDYEDNLKSNVADIKQCLVTGYHDNINAAKFLEKFIQDKPWIHFDLSSAYNKGGLGSVPSDETGFGVWFMESYLKKLNWIK